MTREPDLTQILATVARLEGELRHLRAQLEATRGADAPAPRPGAPQPSAPAAPQPSAFLPTPPAAATPAAPAPARPAVAAPRPAPPRPPAPPPPPREPIQPATLLAIAGAGLFLLGVVFFLWLSIQRGWINPPARVLLGLATSAGLGFIAVRTLPTERRTVGVALLAAALGTLDFSAFAGFSLYHLYPAAFGFALSVVGALVAGGLGARFKAQGALAVGLLAALVAPPIFSTGGHHEISLALYLAGLMAALLAVPYRAHAGARWGVVRWLATAGVWLLLATSLDAPRADAPLLMTLLAGHLGLSLAWIWLPGPAEREAPSSPLTLWALALMAAASLLWGQWRHADWPQAAFAAPALALGALNLALVVPMRARLRSGKADFGLLALGAAFLALAVPIALDWAWVGPLWGLFALALAYAAHKVEERDDWSEAEQANLRRLALGLTVLASLRWVATLDLLFEGHRSGVPLFNGLFALGAFATAAWLLLALRGGALGGLGFVLAQLIGTLALCSEAKAVAESFGAVGRSASVATTVLLAASGALQWLASLKEASPALRRGLTVAGYIWLAVASFKLIFGDLAQADLPARALAFLAVGGIFLGTALVGARARQDRVAD